MQRSTDAESDPLIAMAEMSHQNIESELPQNLSTITAQEAHLWF
jgi:hypothetical protein